MNHESKLERRDFFKSSFAAAVGVGGADIRVGGASEPSPAAKPIASRPFGKTGLELPVLGMGSSAMVAAWSQGSGSKPAGVEARAALVRHAYDRGVRYFDPARSYYDAEQVIGRGLKGVAAKCVLASKVTVLKPEMFRPSVEKSLRRSASSTSTAAVSAS